MQVVLSNLWFLYLTLTCFLFIFLYKTEKYRTGSYNNSFLNKENTNILKGGLSNNRVHTSLIAFFK